MSAAVKPVVAAMEAPPPPRLESENPFIAASRAARGIGDGYSILTAAAEMNEPRVRELIAIARKAQFAVDLTVAVADLKRLEFGLGALLPPVNVRIRVPLESARSLSGKKR